MCGAVLADAAKQDEHVEVQCGGCDRQYRMSVDDARDKLENSRTRCQMCGGELAFPEELRASLPAETRAVRTRCPCCGAASQARPVEEGLEAACVGCRLIFTCDDQGGAAQLVGIPGARATPADVDEARLPSSPEHDVMRAVLRARAERQELARMELRRVVDNLKLVEAWPGVSGRVTIPLRRPEAIGALSALLFRPHDLKIDEGGVHLSYNLTEWEYQRPTGLLGQPDRNRAQEKVSRFVLMNYDIRLHDDDAGVTLGFSSSARGGPVLPLPADQVRDLGLAFSAAKPALRSYVFMLGLFGFGAQGMPAASARADAVERRLQELGVPGSLPVGGELIPLPHELYGT
jgi:hypothetical protein